MEPNVQKLDLEAALCILREGKKWESVMSKNWTLSTAESHTTYSIIIYIYQKKSYICSLTNLLGFNLSSGDPLITMYKCGWIKRPLNQQRQCNNHVQRKKYRTSRTFKGSIDHNTTRTINVFMEEFVTTNKLVT